MNKGAAKGMGLGTADPGPAALGRRRRGLIDPRLMDLVVYKTYADLRAEAAKT